MGVTYNGLTMFLCKIYMVKLWHDMIQYRTRKGGDIMALTDAKRRANNKYIAKTMTVMGCKVRREEADAFRSACKAGGTTPNAVFRRAMQDYMAARQETNGPGDNEGAVGG